MHPEKVAESLIFRIERIDCLRSPFKWFPRNYFYSFKHDIPFDKALRKHDPSLEREINSFLNSYWKKSPRELRERPWQAIIDFLLTYGLIVVLIVGLAFLAGIFLTVFSIIFKIKVDAALSIIFYFIILVFSILYLSLWRLKKHEDYVGRLNDEELRVFTQKLIDYTSKFFKENNIDYKKFHVELRHDDYEGLTYKKKDKNKYIAYFKVERG